MKAKADGNLRRIFKERMLAWHWVPIESPTVNGIPDHNCCWNGHEFWIEYKFTDGYAVGLRPEQVGWALRRHRAGGVSFIAVRRTTIASPRVPIAVDDLYLYRGADAAELKANGLGTAGPAPLGHWSGGPSPGWDWNEVSTLLLRGRDDRPGGRSPG